MLVKIRDTFFKIFFILTLIGLTSCQKPNRASGLCLSFDDRSVKEWYSLRELFQQYNAQVTFFVTQFDSLSYEEIGMLKKLQEDGHEIASHGALHVQAERYIKEYSYKDYLANEIDASVNSMKRKDFNPTSFAYPYGSKYWFTDFLILKRFKITRGVAALRERELDQVNETYFSFNGNKKIAAIEFDSQTGLTEKMIVKGIERAQQKNEILILCGHEPNDSSARKYSFSKNLLEFILKETNRCRLKYYRVSDLADL